MYIVILVYVVSFEISRHTWAFSFPFAKLCRIWLSCCNSFVGAGASSNRSAVSLPTSMKIPSFWQRETRVQTPSGEIHIEDVISFGTEVLFLVRVPPSFGFPNKERLQCQFGSPTRSSSQTKVLAVHLQESLAAVVCGAPPEDLPWDTSSVLIKLDKDQEIRTGKADPNYRALLPWNSTKVVYVIFSTEKDVAVFARGLNQTLITELPEPGELKQFKCVYANLFETAVTAQANEVFRCGHPLKSMINAVSGKKMTLKFEEKILPSVAYYNPQALKPVGIHTTSSILQVSEFTPSLFQGRYNRLFTIEALKTNCKF